MLRIIVFVAAVLIANAIHAAPPASGSSVPPGAAERRLHDTQAQVQKQLAQSTQLRQRVDDLQRRSAADRAQQVQRDREIADLQRKLDALQAKDAPAPAPPHSVGGHR